MKIRSTACLLALVVWAAAVPRPTLGAQVPVAAPCARQCLLGVAEQYLAALSGSRRG